MAVNPADTAAPVPERTHDQRMKALRRANDIRTRRAQLKRDLKAGKTTVDGLLLDPPEWVMTAKVFDMILAVPKYGRVKANKILGQCRISPSKTIGGLSQRQRAELVRCSADSLPRALGIRRCDFAGARTAGAFVRSAGLY